MKILSIILLLLTVTSCATTSQKRESIPVAAGQFYAGSYINVRSPNSEDWFLINSSSNGMEFARTGVSDNETFGAQVLFFHLPMTKSKEEFVALIKKAVEADTDSSRFKIVSSEYSYSDSRGYPCVNVKSIVNDTKAKTQGGKQEALLLQSIALYCRHPVIESGFSAIYSHRGVALYNKLHDEAQSYIDGIQVPENAQ